MRLREYNEAMQKKRRKKKKKKLRSKKGSLKRTTKSKVKASRSVGVEVVWGEV